VLVAGVWVIMKTTLVPVFLSTAFALTLACASANDESEPEPVRAAPAQSATRGADARFNPRLLRRFKPLRPRLESGPPPSKAMIDLGRMLYFETRLSKDGSLSCNSCHDLQRYGVDAEPTSIGFKGQRGARNAPSVYHAAGHLSQFWDGRAADVEEQAKGPITNPAEMALADGAAAVRALQDVPAYKHAFKAAFPGSPKPITFDNIGVAIGAFERGLVARSRWDDYLEGNSSALTPAEVDGLRVFTNVGCMVCHTGELLGGSSYQKLGAVESWPNQKDQGRFEVTGADADRMTFKVPSLRDVEKTAPYFHDASARTLPDAVRMMGKHQLGVQLSGEEVSSIVTWLNSLTGRLPAEYIEKPALLKAAP
jgi:cytochrome c peroxidase